MPVLTFDTAQIREIGHQLEIAAGGIDRELMRLELDILTLKESWSGDAQEAYTRAQAEWSLRMRTLQKIVSAAANLCEFAADTYEDTEGSIEKQFG